ncbi:MAG: hypothetical protein EP329_23195 [Deltaproteobacteria bacterium]|nr:MAG: hypothetical protein EP329_23195 [Deltaproteobacteria bacterium]
MDDFSVLLVAGAYLAMLGGVALAIRRRRRARAAGKPRPPKGATDLELTFDDVTVTVTHGAGADRAFTMLWATCPGLPRSLAVAPQGLSSARGDVATEDEGFDAIADVRGEILDVTARLDPAAREALVGFLLRDDGRVRDGAVSRSYDHRLEGAELQAAAARLAAIARTLGHGETPERLADNVAREPLPAAQARNLALLLAYFPEHPQAQALARPAPRFEDPWIALLKGSARGDRAAVDAATASLLARELLRPDDLVIAGAAAARLQRTGEAEPLLVAMLEDASLRGAAIAALAERGSLDAVVPLDRVARSLLAGDDRRAAREAIARIQARAGDVAPGRLSLAAPQDAGGALTLSAPAADGEDGEPPA